MQQQDIYAGADAVKGNEQLMGICGICHDPLEDGIGAECGHAFCRICVSDYLGTSDGTTICPTCNRPLSIDLSAPATNSVLLFVSTAVCFGEDCKVQSTLAVFAVLAVVPRTGGWRLCIVESAWPFLDRAAVLLPEVSGHDCYMHEQC